MEKTGGDYILKTNEQIEIIMQIYHMHLTTQISHPIFYVHLIITADLDIVFFPGDWLQENKTTIYIDNPELPFVLPISYKQKVKFELIEINMSFDWIQPFHFHLQIV